MTTETNNSLLSTSMRAEIDCWLAKYPAEHKQSALIAALTIAQEANEGYLTEPLMNAVTDYLDLPAVVGYEVATFYSMFHLKKEGRHRINVCTNISCMLCGSKKVVEHIENKLDIKMGETTKDERFTLNEVECLAACANAPMMQIGKTYYEDLTPEKIDKILEKLP